MKTNFKQYLLIESMLEDIQYDSDGSDDALLANLHMIHEIEYKMSELKDGFYNIHTKLYKNLMRRFFIVGKKIFVNTGPKFIQSFNTWLNFHRIDDIDVWVDTSYDFYLQAIREEYGNNTDVFEFLDKYGMTLGGVTMTGQDIRDNGIYSKKDMMDAKNDILLDIDAYRYEASDWLKNVKGVEFNANDSIDYLKRTNLIDDFLEYTADELIGNYLSEDLIKSAMHNYMYPLYMEKFGNKLKPVVSNAKKAIDRIMAADKNDSKLGSNFTHAVKEDDIIKFGNKIYKRIAEMTTALSLALNVNHVNGNILEDYLGLSTEDMDKLSTNEESLKWKGEIDAILHRFSGNKDKSTYNF